jgi:O-methyltransferase domain/Dimerisation domain
MSAVPITEQPPPATVMMQYLSGFQISQAVYAVAKLGVATILEQEGPQPVGELAERTAARPEALSRLIRTLTPLGLFSSGSGNRVAVTPLGAVLSEKHPQSLHGLTCMWMETHYLPFSELLHSVRTGTPGAEKYLGQSFMSWMGAEPDRAVQFSRAMADVTSSLRTGMFDTYRLSAGNMIADIGGADGSVLVELLNRDDDSSRRGIVFDQPNVTPTAERTLAAAGLADRVSAVAGDFFTAVPKADIYLLGYILHDWDDESSRRILASIAQAASRGARLLIVEGIVPDGDTPHLTKSVDLTMLGMVTGKERSEQEYRDLLDTAGFTLDRVVATPSPFSILEATLR